MAGRGLNYPATTPLFRPVDRLGNVERVRLTPQSVALLVKRACRRAGLDPTRYAGHSLRSGLATRPPTAGPGGAPPGCGGRADASRAVTARGVTGGQVTSGMRRSRS